ncbi:MAG: formylglycine-generating enzyme family protein [Gammaproteobacteria bacterium]|nr:formylglycine-generating enzyme family protein [Gammaproteobacteria bacterium]
MGQTEVTYSHYQHCVAAGACPETARGFNHHPVTKVSYNDITQHYIPWLNNVTNEHFRLPSEAEWEYAARAGGTTRYSWGDAIDCSKAHYNGGENSSCYYKVNGKLRGTTAVATYPANNFGLFDMHGNVWEWTQDCWHSNYNGSPTSSKAWTQQNCKQYVARGGSWVISAENLRITYRNKYNKTERNPSLGFRLVQEIE